MEVVEVNLMKYCSLHNHTEYSNLRGFLDAIVRPNELVNKAYKLGYKGVAITDHDVLSCHVDERLLSAVAKIKEEDPEFKLILGNEIYLIDEENYKECKKFFHFILLAKDEIGHRQLRELSSRAWERSFVSSGITRTPTFYRDIEEVVGVNKGHIIASTACLGGFLDVCILEKNSEEVTKFLQWCINNFGKENFFLEMQSAISEEQQIANKGILQLSEYFDIPYIITDDTHYLDKEDFPIHSAYLNSRGSGDRETETFYKYTYLKSPEEIKEILSGEMTEEQIQKGLDNSELVYNQIQEYSLLKSVMVPSRPTPKFEMKGILEPYYNQYEYIKKFANSEYEQDRYLLYLIEEGWLDKNWPLDDLHLDRINTELEQVWVISDKIGQRLSSYFELTRDIVKLAWEAGSTVGISRGSCSGFALCYLIDIIQIDGLKQGLFYWRFLNKERVELPDIDLDFDPFYKEKIMEKVREHFGAENVLNTITYKTESTKSAILTACRGLEIPVEEAQVLSSMVPMIRGRVLPLDTCINGDEENEAVNGFKEALQKHPNLEAVIRKIEGLISGRGVHASSVYIFNNGYLAQNSLMRAPNGLLITAYNMHQSDSMGALKMDFLYTEAQSKIGVCLKLLLDDKMINWQGDLYNTYRKYLHPDIIDYDNQEMWDKVSNNEIPDLFQFDTQVGLECAKKVKPHNLNELTLANSVMRLMGDGKEKPIDRFARFKNNINEWYEEMQKEGLTEEEQELAKKVLGSSYGCSIEQETLMVGAMEIAGFSLKDANSLRKVVAKKKLKDIPKMKELFFKANARKEFLEYMWKVLIEPQLGYAFSRNHCLAYSMEAVQEMNLATKYPNIYWACACLTVNAKQGVADDEDVEEITSGGTSDYGKISRAISKMQLQHIKVELPDINKSAVDFKPDNETNSILFGFGGLKGVSTDYFKEIIDNRPYNSYKDFYDRVLLPTAQMFALIKSGVFSKIESKSRKELLIDYLNYEMDKNKSFNKDKLTMANFGKMVEGNCIPEKFIDISKMYYFKQWLEDNAVNSDKTSYTISEDTPVRFFLERCAPFLKQEDYSKVEDVYTVSYKKFKKFYDNYMEEIKDWLNTTEAVECYNKLVRQTNIDTLFAKYCQGTDAHLDMDSLGYYYSRHELSNVRYGDYGGQPITISNFEDLPLHKEKDKYYYLAGTVIDVNKNKKTVALLTPECGVVDVKFYDTLFINYNKKIAVTDKNGKKTVVEDSWLQKGSTIIVNGTRNENTFMCAKSYSFSRFTVALITDITESGSCKLTFKRKE